MQLKNLGVILKQKIPFIQSKNLEVLIKVYLISNITLQSRLKYHSRLNNSTKKKKARNSHKNSSILTVGLLFAYLHACLVNSTKR